MRRRGLSPEQVDDAINLCELGWSLARTAHDDLTSNHPGTRSDHLDEDPAGVPRRLR